MVAAEHQPGRRTDVLAISRGRGSIEGRLRVTSWGMIQASSGLPRSLARPSSYATATLGATKNADQPDPAWRPVMDRLAQIAMVCIARSYAATKRFIQYFRAALPEVELGSMPWQPSIRRTADHGVDSLRNSGVRVDNPSAAASWLGPARRCGRRRTGELDVIRHMYEQWPFFRSMLDLLAMVLAESDVRIAAEYDRRLVSQELQPVGADLRRRLDTTTQSVLQATGKERLLTENAVLRRSIEVRNPYVYPINLVQIELLRRLRETEEAEPQIANAFMVTVNGIAAGMRNTG
jgi:phosphoenolpyruvate carboxylase